MAPNLAQGTVENTHIYLDPNTGDSDVICQGGGLRQVVPKTLLTQVNLVSCQY